MMNTHINAIPKIPGTFMATSQDKRECPSLRFLELLFLHSLIDHDCQIPADCIHRRH
jgi:hypothetical protein